MACPNNDCRGYLSTQYKCELCILYTCHDCLEIIGHNKTDEHEIIYYQQCEDDDYMSIAEKLVFKKLSNYREQANRERFVLPEDKDITFFIDKIKNCINLVK